MSDAAARERLDIDIACVGFGPAMGGFLTTLGRGLAERPDVMPQVLCYERADDLGFGVSGVATKARAVRQSFPELKPDDIPLAAEIRD